MTKQQTNYKQTEIGEIPQNWNLAKLNSYVEINPTRKLSKGEKAAYVGMADIKPYERKITNFITKPYKGGAKFVNRDTLLARITPCLENGKTAYVNILENNEVGFGSTEFIVLARRQNKTVSKYIYYLARSPRLRNIAIKSMVGSSGRQRVQIDKLENTLFAFPEIDGQKEVASILSSLDDKIELNHKMNQALEEMGKTLFKHWFIDFEFPNNEGKPYKSSGGEIVDSELEEIPKGWKVSNIDEVCKTIGGGTPSTKKKEYWDNGDIKWATPSDITSLKSPIIFDTDRKINEQGLKNSSAKLLPKGTILLTSRATVGLLAISAVPITTNQGFISVVCNNLKNYYLYFNLLRRKNEIISKASGSTFREISKGTFRKLKVLVPKKDVHDEFIKLIKPLFEQISINTQEAESLSKIRDSLLPRLMSGRLRI